MPKKYALYIFIGALFIFGVSIGFFASRLNTNSSPAVKESNESENNAALFNSQTASLRGEILAIDGKNLTIKNLNTETTGTIRISDRVIILKPGSDPETDLSSLELNRQVLISSEMNNGNYEAVTIQYVLGAPSLPPIPSRAPTPLPSPGS